METHQRPLPLSGMAILLVAMLFVGCQASPPPTATRIIATSPAPSMVALVPSARLSPTIPATEAPSLPSATPTSTPTVIPASKIALPHDLLFLSDGRLMRWSHIQGTLQTAVIDVAGYSTSQDGAKIAILRKTGITANAIETFDLTILDTSSGNFVTLLNSLPRLADFKISPDGRWIAVMNDLQQLYILPTDGSDSGAKIAECRSGPEGDCNDLAWSVDSLAVLWDDSSGIWQAGPNAHLPVLVASNQIKILDPKDQITQKQVQFHGLSWSPFGRYVLTRIQPLGSNVSWQAIVDTRTGRIAEIPTSYQLDEPSASTHWLTNGNLLVIHGESEPETQGVALEIWQILPTRDDLMSLDFRWDIGDGQSIVFNGNEQVNSLPITVCQLTDRTLSLAWNTARLDGPGELFTFDIKYGILNKIAELPAHIVKTLWTPEADAALVQSSDGTLTYVSADGNILSDLTNRIGRQSCCFTWLADEPAFP